MVLCLCSTLGYAMNHNENPAEPNQYVAPSISFSYPATSAIDCYYYKRRVACNFNELTHFIARSWKSWVKQENKPGDPVIATSSNERRCGCSKKESNLVRGLHTNSMPIPQRILRDNEAIWGSI